MSPLTIAAWLTILGFALSSSIDNFGVGVSYGITKIKVGLLPNTIIALIAFALSMAGMYFGKYIGTIMPGGLSTVIASLFVFIIGVRIILITLMAKKQANEVRAKRRRKSLNTYLDNPSEADMDNSGEISIVESLVLGLAVSMNALTSGLGAGLIGLSPLGVSIVTAVFSFLAIWSGVSLGERAARIRIGGWNLGQFSTVISGGILLLIAAHMLMALR